MLLFTTNFYVLSAMEINPHLSMIEQESKFYKVDSHYHKNNIFRQQPATNDSLIQEGRMDALTYFNGSRAFALSFASSFLLPPAGLAIATINSFTTPKAYNLGIPIAKKPLILNDDYYFAYVKKARAKKAWSSWAGFITGTAFCIAGLTMTGFIWELPLIKK